MASTITRVSVTLDVLQQPVDSGESYTPMDDEAVKNALMDALLKVDWNCAFCEVIDPVDTNVCLDVNRVSNPRVV